MAVIPHPNIESEEELDEILEADRATGEVETTEIQPGDKVRYNTGLWIFSREKEGEVVKVIKELWTRLDGGPFQPPTSSEEILYAMIKTGKGFEQVPYGRLEKRE